jgi:hypothetical protein
MKSILLATSAIVLASIFSAPANAGGSQQYVGCNVPQGFEVQFAKDNLARAWLIIASVNTDAGNGNGEESRSRVRAEHRRERWFLRPPSRDQRSGQLQPGSQLASLRPLIVQRVT